MLIDHLLQLPAAAIPYTFGKYLTERYPGRVILETNADQDFEGHADANRATLTPHAGTYQQWASFWYNGVHRLPKIASAAVQWDGHVLDLFQLTYAKDDLALAWIVADSLEVAEGYFADVSTWSNELDHQILVFEGGCWTKNDNLFRDIKSATFDNLILRGALKDEIRGDLEDFFASREMYRRYRIPWKRGILFIGPPGNGKTHAVKALLNHADRNCLYVKSFDLPGMQYPQAGIASVFERARRTTPCIVVLEDLDALVGDHNRSFFLNELDGFAANDGVVVLATTNHPERLDPAILDRPSRFDRKYFFDLPAHAEREAYVRMWNGTLDVAIALDDVTLEGIVADSEGYSFAYLRELFLSSMMRWISDGRTTSFGRVMADHVSALREQMSSQTDVLVSSGAEAGTFGMVPGMPPHVLARMFGARSMRWNHVTTEPR